jgi:LITAF-like zinc ribbon domain
VSLENPPGLTAGGFSPGDLVEEELRCARHLAAIYDNQQKVQELREERRWQEEEATKRHVRRQRELSDEGFRCPYCRTREYPVIRNKVSAAGWVFFWLTCLFLCLPICWIGLLIKDTYRECPACGARS